MIVWLINCELDDWVEMSNSEFENDDILSKRKFNDLEQRSIETQAQLQQENFNNSNILRSQTMSKCN